MAPVPIFFFFKIKCICTQARHNQNQMSTDMRTEMDTNRSATESVERCKATRDLINSLWVMKWRELRRKNCTFCNELEVTWNINKTISDMIFGHTCNVILWENVCGVFSSCVLTKIWFDHLKPDFDSLSSNFDSMSPISDSLSPILTVCRQCLTVCLKTLRVSRKLKQLWITLLIASIFRTTIRWKLLSHCLVCEITVYQSSQFYFTFEYTAAAH